MVNAILFAKFTTVLFVCFMSLIIGIGIGITIGRKGDKTSIERKSEL